MKSTCYIASKVYLRATIRETPYELWKGKQPNVRYFYIFRSWCYILNDKEQLKKFDSQNNEGIFLGYSTNSWAYRIINLWTEKVIESINVKVDDEELDICMEWREDPEAEPFRVIPDEEK